MSQFSRILGVLQPIFLVGLFVPGILATCVGMFLAGRWWASQPEPPDNVLPGLAVALLVALILTLLYPLVTLSKGANLPSTRIRLLPVPIRYLHALDLFSHWVSPVIAPVSLGMFFGSLGIAAGGELGLALAAFLSALLFTLVLLTLQSGAGLLLQWIFVDRRRGQYFGIVLLLILSSSGFIPVLLESLEFDEAAVLRVWNLLDLVLPSGQVAEILTVGLIRDWVGVSLTLVFLLLEVVLLYLLCWWLYQLIQDSSLRRNRRGARLPRAPMLLPGLQPGVAGVAQIEILQVLRSGRGKLGLLLSPVVVAIVGWAVLSSGEIGEIEEAVAVAPGPLLGLWAVTFGFLAFQPVVYNLFGSNEEGLTRLLLLPASELEIVRGKTWASRFLFCAAILLGSLGALLVDLSGSGLVWLTVLGVGVAGVTVTAPVGLCLSLLFPKKSKLDTWGEKGNPHPLAGVLGTLAVIPIVGFPALILLAALVSGHWMLWLGLLGIWGLLCGLSSRLLLRFSQHLLLRRREQLYQIVEGR